MTALGRYPPLTIALAAAAGLSLLALLAVFLPATLLRQDAAGASVTMTRAPILAVADLPALETYKAISDKPLFNPGRMPDPAPPAEAAKSALPSLSDYRLVGIVLMKDTKLALVERRQAKQVVTLHSGDDLDGRHVENIGPEGVQLSGGSGREVLTMPRIAGFSRSGRKGATADKQ